jgi:hypothetical protein
MWQTTACSTVVAMQDMERAALMRPDTPALVSTALDTAALDTTALVTTALVTTTLVSTALAPDFSKIPPFVRDRLVGRLARAQALARRTGQPSPARSAGDPASGA